MALPVSFFGPATEKMDVVRKSEREGVVQGEGRGPSSRQLKKRNFELEKGGGEKKEKQKWPQSRRGGAVFGSFLENEPGSSLCGWRPGARPCSLSLAGPTAAVPLATFPKIIFSRLSSLLES